MQVQGIHVETLQDPRIYAPVQIELACRIAAVLGRGRLVLAEPPKLH